MFGPSLMNQNKFSLELASAEYYFLQVGIFCKASRRIFFEVLYAMIARILLFHMLGPSLMNQYEVFYLILHCVMHQNDFSFEQIARLLFST